MRRVLIIGANGQDGSILAKFFHEYDIILGCSSSQSWITSLEWRGPGFHPSTLAGFLSVVETFKPQIVYYLAAVHGPSGSGKNEALHLDEQRCFIDNLGLNRFLQTLGDIGLPVNLFYAASSKICSDDVEHTFDPSQLNPSCAYSASKIRAIEILESICPQNVIPLIGVLFHHHSYLRKGDYALNILADAIATNSFSPAHSALRNPDAVEDFSCAIEVMRVVSNLVKKGVGGRHIIRSGVLRSLRELSDEVTTRLSFKEQRLGTIETRDNWIHKSKGSGSTDFFDFTINDSIVEALVRQVVILRTLSSLNLLSSSRPSFNLKTHA